MVVLVLSHRDPPLVRRLVKRLTDGTNTAVALHHDPRGPDLKISESESVMLVPDPQPCTWGRMDLALAVLRGMEFAHRRVPELSWILVVSGADYPCRSMAAIERELQGTTADAFLRWFRVDDDPALDVHPWQAATRRRYLRRRRLPWTHRSVPFPRRHPFRRGLQLFVGDMWVNLGANALAHVLEQRLRRPEVESFLTWSPIPDEALVPSLLLNDRGSLDVVSDGRRYIRWVHGSWHPELLQLSDVPLLSASTAFFARKVDSERTPEVLDRLDAAAVDA